MSEAISGLLSLRALQRVLSEVALCVFSFLGLFDPAGAAGVHGNSKYSNPAFSPPAAYTQLDKEIWEKSQSLRPQPSTDTTLTIVKVGSVTYRIPRNYITSFGNIPTIKITVPGYTIPAFQPLAEEIRDCFGSILQAEKAGCASIEVNVDLPYISHQELLSRRTPMFRSKEPRKGPFEYDVYDIGPENARTEVYTKNYNGDFVLFSCLFFVSDRNLGVCDDRFALKDGNSAHFFFYQNQIENIPNIEAGIRNLMEGFRARRAD